MNAVAFVDARVVTRRDFLRAERTRFVQEGLELDFAIAQHVRIRGASGPVLGEEMFENAIPVFGSEVARVERHAELRAHAHGIGAVAFGVAFAEALVLFPVLHEQAADGVTGALQQQGGNRGIHATGHADDDVHGASSRQARLANSERLPAR